MPVNVSAQIKTFRTKLLIKTFLQNLSVKTFQSTRRASAYDKEGERKEGESMQRVRRQLDLPGRREETAGAFVTVAVLDSGAELHPDLAQRMIVFQDFVNGEHFYYDDNGHGTHICGIICGSGEMSGGRFRGVAPNARLAVGKVLDERGNGDLAHMIEGLNWVLSIKDVLNIRILNMSVGIGSGSDSSRICELHAALKAIWDSGILIVSSAGNRGPGENTISDISGKSGCMVVGCYDAEYYRWDPMRCETYSGCGSLRDAERKPDIVAPGTKIISCNAAFRQTVKGNRSRAYCAKSGTSMATAICSGAAALTLGKYPHLTNTKLKQRFHLTARDVGLPWNRQGYGMINVRGLLDSFSEKD